MTKIASNTPLLLLTLAMALTGCASTTGLKFGNKNAGAENAEQFAYEVKPGDRLGDIALQITGKIDNWQIIAERNGITDPRKLAAGQVIIIPAELLDNVLSINGESTGTPAVETVQATNTVQPPLPVTTGNGVSVARGNQTSDRESAEITVIPVEVNRSFELEPLDSSAETGDEAQQFDSQAPEIRVLGTYYPKGIYEQPAIYAKLKRRVSPGTVFQLDSVVNDWYKIITDDGVGYIRQTDGALVE